MDIAKILLDLFVIFLAAKVAAELFERVGQPAVIGELLAGAIIGPFALGLIGRPDQGLISTFHGDAALAQEALDLVYHLVAELGVVILLFFVGLETRLVDIFRVGPRAATVALLGVIAPFGLGYLLMGVVLQRPQLEALFMGVAMVATSVGITARVLRDIGVLASTESRIILGAAVVDDIVGMVILAVVVGIASTGGVSAVEIAFIAGQAVLFTAFVSLVGSGVIRRYSLNLDRLKIEGAPLTVSLIAMLGLAALAAQIGLAAIIGAFLAGMVFAEAKEHFDLEHQALPIYQFFVPFFFVITGSQVDWRLFLRGDIMSIAAGVTLVAIIGKVVGCGIPMLGMGTRSAAIVGVGMAPRGEVGLIVASMGLSLGAISGDVFSVVVVMSIATTLFAPPILRALYTGYQWKSPPDGENALQAGQLPDM